MSRIVTFLGVLSLIMGVTACKGQAERDVDQAATDMQGARAGGSGMEGGDGAIGSEPAGDWDDEELEDDSMPEGVAQAGEGAQPDPSMVTVQLKAPFGDYLADSSGMSLYIFEADEEGEPSKCYDACAEAWPPFIAEGGTGTTGEMSAPAQLDASMLGAVPRRDGRMQVTYNGLPLYYFVQDESPGDTEGQGVDGFGDTWYLMAPSGDDIDDAGDADDAEMMDDIDDMNEID